MFHTCGSKLGSRLKRIPDGEPGGRRGWISWQFPLFRANPFFRLVDPSKGMFGHLRLADGVKPEDVRFGELGYSREARTSYQDFLAARERGDLPAGVRFQVSLPTPFAAVQTQFAPEVLAVVEEAYTKAMLREVEVICAAVPHKDLCIQWDLCLEMVVWDGASPRHAWPYPGDPKAQIIERLKRISDAIPADVELGYHFCYGDMDGKPFFAPKDAAMMVELANTLTTAVNHPIAYIHMPVQADRTDDAFFQPFADMKLKAGTEIYLGLVHASDGVEGVKRRVETAQRHLQDFGIATECGIARARTPDVVDNILDIHAQSTTAPAG